MDGVEYFLIPDTVRGILHYHHCHHKNHRHELQTKKQTKKKKPELCSFIWVKTISYNTAFTCFVYLTLVRSLWPPENEDSPPVPPAQLNCHIWTWNQKWKWGEDQLNKKDKMHQMKVKKENKDRHRHLPKVLSLFGNSSFYTNIWCCSLLGSFTNSTVYTAIIFFSSCNINNNLVSRDKAMCGNLFLKNTH